MAKKAVLLAVFLVAMASYASALNVYSHQIEIAVGKDGFAQVIERYSLSFLAGEIESFRKDAAQNGPSLLSWQVDFNWFYPHFGEGSITNAHITFDEVLGALTLDYTITKQFATVVRDEPRTTIWQIPERAFKAYLQGARISIPDNTQIKVILPVGSEVDRSKLFSEAQVSGNEIMLRGISTNKLNFEYRIPKPIAPAFNAVELFTQTNTLIVLAAIAIVAVLAFVYRKKLGEKVENYILAHSEIETRELGEEIEIEA